MNDTALADARARLRANHAEIDAAAEKVAAAQRAADRARQITATAEDALAGAEHMLANAEDRASADLARYISKAGNSKKPPAAATCEEEARRVDAARRQVKIAKAALAPIDQALQDAGNQLAELRRAGEALALEIIEGEALQIVSEFQQVAAEHRATLAKIKAASRWLSEVGRARAADNPAAAEARPLFLVAQRINEKIDAITGAGDPERNEVDAAAANWARFANELGRNPEAAL